MKKIGNVELKETAISPYGIVVLAHQNVNLLQTKQFENGEF
jgi:hypothetical protein